MTHPCTVCGDPVDDGLQCRECRTPEGRARKKAGTTTATLPNTAMLADEATEQATGLAWLKVHGWHTWRIGQRDARGTQDAGVPDVVAIHPDYGLVWWEAKGKGGRPSKEQKTFGAIANAAGVRWVCGGAATMQAVVETIMGEREAA